MLPRRSAAKQSLTATKRIVLCWGFVGLSLAAIVWFGVPQKIQASENILPDLTFMLRAEAALITGKMKRLLSNAGDRK